MNVREAVEGVVARAFADAVADGRDEDAERMARLLFSPKAIEYVVRALKGAVGLR